jgi:hypothetical protein
MNLKHRILKELTSDEYAIVPTEYTEPRLCVLCGTNYKECENVGRLKCRIHTGVITHNLEANAFLYTCCLRPYDYVGCSKSDHMEEDVLGGGGGSDDDDQESRSRDLEEWAILILPSILIQYGVDRPLFSTILYEGGGGGDYHDITYELPMGIEGIMDAAKIRQTLGKMRKESTFLSFVYKEKGGDDFDNDLDKGWRNTMNDDDGINGDGDTFGITASETITTKTTNIPFLIVNRIK